MDSMITELEGILKDGICTELVSYHVSPQVNSTRNNDPSCVEPTGWSIGNFTRNSFSVTPIILMQSDVVMPAIAFLKQFYTDAFMVTP